MQCNPSFKKNIPRHYSVFSIHSRKHSETPLAVLTGEFLQVKSGHLEEKKTSNRGANKLVRSSLRINTC